MRTGDYRIRVDSWPLIGSHGDRRVAERARISADRDTDRDTDTDPRRTRCICAHRG